VHRGRRHIEAGRDLGDGRAMRAFLCKGRNGRRRDAVFIDFANPRLGGDRLRLTPHTTPNVLPASPSRLDDPVTISNASKA